MGLMRWLDVPEVHDLTPWEQHSIEDIFEIVLVHPQLYSESEDVVWEVARQIWSYLKEQGVVVSHIYHEDDILF